MSRKITCLYTKYFFERMYRFLIDNMLESAIDAGDTIWFMQDIEEILITNYGYRRTSGGSLM